jgi:hypothetical protein
MIWFGLVRLELADVIAENGRLMISFDAISLNSEFDELGPSDSLILEPPPDDLGARLNVVK